jgi:hypothetical protein
MKFAVNAVFRWWLILVILAIASVIGWKEERCQAQANQCRAAYETQAQFERVGAPRLTVNQQASEQEEIAAACEPNGYFCRLFSAASLPTVLLVLVGIGGIWAALRTLNTIERQADITERQTKATEDSVNLQETLNQQWLDISGWRREGDSSRELNPPVFTIAADISNPTNAPLTVKSVTIRIIGDESMKYEVGNTLAPNGEPIKITYSYTVKPHELKAYETYALALPIDGFVDYVDCFKKAQRQDFMRACFLGPKSFRDSAVFRGDKKNKNNG